MNHVGALHNATEHTYKEDGAPLEDGATLAELAVAMLVGALVLAACYATYGFASRAVSRWQARSATTTERYVLERRLAEDVRSAAHVTSANMGVDGVRLALLSAHLDTLAVYAAHGGVLFRTGSRQHVRGEAPPPSPEAVRIGTGLIKQVTVSKDGLVHVELEMGALGQAAPGHPAPHRIHVAVASRLRGLHLVPWHAEPDGAGVAVPRGDLAAF